MRRFQIAMLLAAAATQLDGVAWGANALTVQSKSVPACATDVTVDVYVTNDQPWEVVCVPLVLRTVEGGAFIADHLGLGSSGRLAQFELEGGYIVTHSYAVTGTYVALPYHNCPLDSSGHTWAPINMGADFVSPDAVLRVSIRMEDTAIFHPGTDSAGDPSLLLHFDVQCEPGVFEIDTVCIAPYTHLLYALIDETDETIFAVPQFTKGVITVGCECDCHTDPQCDGIFNIVDWIKIRDVVRGAIPPIPDPNPMCPVQTTDVNCDGQTTIADQNLMFAVVFQGLNPDSVFCDPCQ